MSRTSRTRGDARMVCTRSIDGSHALSAPSPSPDRTSSPAGGVRGRGCGSRGVIRGALASRHRTRRHGRRLVLLLGHRPSSSAAPCPISQREGEWRRRTAKSCGASTSGEGRTGGRTAARETEAGSRRWQEREQVLTMWEEAQRVSPSGAHADVAVPPAWHSPANARRMQSWRVSLAGGHSKGLAHSGDSGSAPHASSFAHDSGQVSRIQTPLESHSPSVPQYQQLPSCEQSSGGAEELTGPLSLNSSSMGSGGADGCATPARGSPPCPRSG
mmetsp:Transcript_41762/g.135443  ORF Transcript_41762/g.135443 Transcript_41762/m.135443 type:complete len:272 (-) Transcript_41762:677-1492(-)